MNIFRLLLVILAVLCAEFSAAQQADTVVVGQKGVKYHVQASVGSSYEWFVEGGEFSSSNGFSFIYVDWGKEPGVFRLGVLERNAMGCAADTLWMNVWLSLDIFPSITAKTLVCPGETIQLTASAEDSVYKDIYYLWSTGETTRTIEAVINEKTRFYCTVFYNGDAVDTAMIDINVIPTFKPMATWTPKRPKQGEDVTFTFHDNRALNFYWTINGVTDSNSSNTFTTRFDSLGFQDIRITASNALGCEQSTDYRLNIMPDDPFLIPNVFSPNGDLEYDELFIDLPEGLRECTVIIYNRWGNALYKSNQLTDQYWDGKQNGEVVPGGTYVIDVVAYTNEGKYLQQSSVVNVLR